MPTSLPPSILIAGPCYAFTRNKAFYFKGNVTATPKRTEFEVASSQYGKIEGRELDFTWEIRGTPVGRLDALSILWPYGVVNPGDLVHAWTKLSSISISTGIGTFNSTARFRNGAPVYIAAVGAGTLPTGITQQLYYLHILSGTTGTLHTTEAAAIAGTSPVIPSVNLTGEVRIIEQEYLSLIDFNGNQYLFENTAVMSSPGINASAASTAIGEVVFEAFRKFGTAPTDAAAFYAKTTGVTLDTSFDPSNIITEAYSLAWGSSAPWSSMTTRSGIKASFPLSLEAVGDDINGITTRRITRADAQFSARPIGISEDDIYAKLVVQSTGAGRGRRLTGTDTLDVTSTTSSSLFFRLYAAVLDPSAINYDVSLDRGGDLNWKPTRSFASGVAKPLYYVGASSAGAP